MYINLRYGDSEAIMNFLEITEGKYQLLCNQNSDKVKIIKNDQNNEAILIKDGEKFDVSVEWEEDPLKVQAIWDAFEEQGANYFGSAEDLFGMIVTIK